MVIATFPSLDGPPGGAVPEGAAALGAGRGGAVAAGGLAAPGLAAGVGGGGGGVTAGTISAVEWVLAGTAGDSMLAETLFLESCQAYHAPPTPLPIISAVNASITLCQRVARSSVARCGSTW
jgi:hypothetical protein